MAGSFDKEVLGIELELDPAGAIRGIQKWDAAVAKAMRDVAGQTSKLDGISRSFFGKTATGWKSYQGEVLRTQGVMKTWASNTAAKMAAVTAKIEEQRQAMAAASKDDVTTHAANISRLEERLRKLQGVNEEVAALGKGHIEVTLSEQLEEDLQKAGEALSKKVEEAGQLLIDPISSVLTKDLPGATKGLGKMLDKGLQKSAISFSKNSAKWSATLVGKGKGLTGAGAARGGVGGAGMEVMGKALGSLGGLVGKMGPLIQTMASLGPILSVTAGAMAAVIKLMIDAEAQAKDFHKELLASASTGEFLARAGWQANVAYASLEETVHDLRNASLDWETMWEWGTTTKDHLAFNNVLTQEGVSISRMRQEFEAAEEAGTAAATSVKFYAEQTATAVAFSRLFGVQIGELGQLQGELMANLGQSFDSVNKDFAIMAQQAAESGMAMNKFYAIVRGISQDLSLYNMRMDVAARLLGKLGKAMSPRTAQQFMQTLSRGFKDMGRLEKVRMTLLAGQGKTREILERDQAQKKKALVAEMGKRIRGGEEMADQLVTAYLKGGKGAGLALSKALEGVEGGGAMRETASRMKMDRKAMQKGLFGLSQAIGDVGPTAMIEMQKAALGRFAKPGASLADMVNELGPAMMAENLGISQEQVRQMAMLEEVMNETREGMVQEMVADGKMSEAQAKEMVGKMSDDQILQKAGIEDAKKLLQTEKDFAKQQTDLTVSLLGRLQMIIDFLMNELYNVMLDIYDTITDIPGLGGDKAKRKMEIAAAKTKNPELVQAVRDAEDAYKAKGSVIMDTKAGQAFASALASTGIGKKKAELESLSVVLGDRENEYGRLRSAGKTDEEAEAELQRMAKERDRLQSEVTAEESQKIEAIKAINTQMQGSNEGTRTQRMAEVLKMAGQGTTTKEAMSAQRMFGKGMDMDLALEKAGFSPEEVAQVMAKAMWALSPQQIVAATGQYTSAVGAPATSVVPGASPKALPATGATAQMLAERGPEATAQNLGVTEKQLTGLLATERASSDLAEGQLAEQQATNKALRQKGAKLDPSFTKGQIGPIFSDLFYEALQKALFEYWLYSGDTGHIEGWLKRVKDAGFSGTLTGPEMVKQVQSLASEQFGVSLPANAVGGMVTGVAGGLASVRPAPGEGLASVGPGERILPAGTTSTGGRGSHSTLAISVDVTGRQGADFNRYLENAIRNAIYEYESRKRLA